MSDLPKVWNKRDHPPKDAVYVGRPSKWGNPFILGVDGDREQVIRRYYQFLTGGDLALTLAELRGKDLVCWCAPQACHADILLREANR
jgi:hypothetical protein